MGCGGEFGGGGGFAGRVVVEFDFDDFEGGAAGVFAGVEAYSRIPADLAGGEGDVLRGVGFEVDDALGTAVEVDHDAVDFVDVGPGELPGDGGAHDDAGPSVFEDGLVLGEGREGEEDGYDERTHWGKGITE